MNVIRNLENGFKSGHVRRLVNDTIVESGEVNVDKELRYKWSRNDFDIGDSNGHPKALRLVFRYVGDNNAYARTMNKSSGIGISFRYITIAANADELYEGIDLCNSKVWPSIRAGGCFLRSPSSERLAHSLRILAEADRLPESYEGWLPWPLAALSYVCRSRHDFLTMADRAERGDFGDVSAWFDAEKRWTNDGVNLADLSSWDANRPFDKQIGRVGLPIGGRTFIDRSVSIDGLQIFIESVIKGRPEIRSKIATDLLKSIANRFHIIDDLDRCRLAASKLLIYADESLYSFQLSTIVNMFTIEDVDELNALQVAASKCVLWPSGMAAAYVPREDQEIPRLRKFPGLLPLYIHRTSSTKQLSAINEVVQDKNPPGLESQNFAVSRMLLRIIQGNASGDEFCRFIEMIFKMSQEHPEGGRADIALAFMSSLREMNAGVFESTLKTMIPRLIVHPSGHWLQDEVQQSLLKRETRLLNDAEWKSLDLNIAYFDLTISGVDDLANTYELDDDIPF